MIVLTLFQKFFRIIICYLSTFFQLSNECTFIIPPFRENICAQNKPNHTHSKTCVCVVRCARSHDNVRCVQRASRACLFALRPPSVCNIMYAIHTCEMWVSERLYMFFGRVHVWFRAHVYSHRDAVRLNVRQLDDNDDDPATANSPIHARARRLRRPNNMCCIRAPRAGKSLAVRMCVICWPVLNAARRNTSQTYTLAHSDSHSCNSLNKHQHRREHLATQTHTHTRVQKTTSTNPETNITFGYWTWRAGIAFVADGMLPFRVCLRVCDESMCHRGEHVVMRFSRKIADVATIFRCVCAYRVTRVNDALCTPIQWKRVIMCV